MNHPFILKQFCLFYFSYIIVDEALFFLNISDGGGDRDVMRQLIKVTESRKMV